MPRLVGIMNLPWCRCKSSAVYMHPFIHLIFLSHNTTFTCNRSIFIASYGSFWFWSCSLKYAYDRPIIHPSFTPKMHISPLQYDTLAHFIYGPNPSHWHSSSPNSFVYSTAFPAAPSFPYHSRDRVSTLFTDRTNYTPSTDKPTSV
jgi:hypothetical protein